MGLFSSHVFGVPPEQVKIIFLDVRSLSDEPALHLPEFIANLLWPVKPYLLALTRWVAIILGVTPRFEGDMLGAEQWEWLEAQLAESQASLHLVVSSVQVLAVNPIIEGWGHYPRAQARLLALLRQHRPRGLVLLSGDVHFAELLATQPEDGTPDDEAKEALEVTSSGMTHTCFATAMGMCEMAVHRYDRPRLTPKSYYGGFNYGTVEVDWAAHEAWVRVHNKRGQPVLQTRRKLDAPPGTSGAAIGEPFHIEDNNDLYFFLAALVFLAVLTALAFSGVRWVWRRRQQYQARRRAAAAAKNGNRKAKKDA